jgi:hypothetical protein
LQLLPKPARRDQGGLSVSPDARREDYFTKALFPGTLLPFHCLYEAGLRFADRRKKENFL